VYDQGSKMKNEKALHYEFFSLGNAHRDMVCACIYRDECPCLYVTKCLCGDSQKGKKNEDPS